MSFKNDNKPASQAAWDACKQLAVQEQLSNKKLYVMDVFCGTNARLPAWPSALLWRWPGRPTS